jgi:hypothetical protein
MMSLFSPPSFFHPRFPSKTTDPVKLASDSVIFILRYLLRGVVPILIKKSILKFAAVSVCNVGLIYYYLSPTLESANRFTSPTRMWKATRLEIVISFATRIESMIQTGALSLWLSAAVTGIDAAVKLRNLARSVANSVTTFLKRSIPIVSHKEKLAVESESFEKDIIHFTRSAHYGIPGNVSPKSAMGQHSSILVPNYRKRIDVNEILGEEMAEGDLVQT